MQRQASAIKKQAKRVHSKIGSRLGAGKVQQGTAIAYILQQLNRVLSTRRDDTFSTRLSGLSRQDDELEPPEYEELNEEEEAMFVEFMSEWSQVDPDSVAMDNMFEQDEVLEFGNIQQRID